MTIPVPDPRARLKMLAEHVADIPEMSAEEIEALLDKVEARGESGVADAIARVMTEHGKHGLCRGCGAPIYWLKHRNGKATPYDARPEAVGVNHFVVCPRREQFKRHA